MSSLGVCPDKAILLDAYNQATSAHAEALSLLRRDLASLTREQYELAYEQSEELRLAARTAHQSLVRHVIFHGC